MSQTCFDLATSYYYKELYITVYAGTGYGKAILPSHVGAQP